MILPGSVGLSAFRTRRALQEMAIVLSKRCNVGMDADPGNMSLKEYQ